MVFPSIQRGWLLRFYTGVVPDSGCTVFIQVSPDRSFCDVIFTLVLIRLSTMLQLFEAYR